MIKAKERIRLKTQRKKRRTDIAEKEVEAKLTRDERRMGSLIAVETGRYSMIADYRRHKEIVLGDDEDDESSVEEQHVQEEE